MTTLPKVNASPMPNGDRPDDTDVAEPREVWHEHFRDPEHKLVLRSKDDVLFRVSMFHLSKAR
jgi:hypothetical protein